MKDLNMDNENFAADLGPPLEKYDFSVSDSDSDDEDLDIGTGVDDEEPDHGFDSDYEEPVFDDASDGELDICYNRGFKHTVYYQCRENESESSVEELDPSQACDLKNVQNIAIASRIFSNRVRKEYLTSIHNCINHSKRYTKICACGNIQHCIGRYKDFRMSNAIAANAKFQKCQVAKNFQTRKKWDSKIGSY